MGVSVGRTSVGSSAVQLTQSPERMETFGRNLVHEVRERCKVFDSVDEMPPQTGVPVSLGGLCDWAHESAEKKCHSGVEG